MRTKLFIPHGGSVRVDMGKYLAELEQEKITHPNSALGKLIRNGESEATNCNNENSAYFFSEAARMLSESGISEEREQGQIYYRKAAEQYELAAERILSKNVNKPHEVAVLYDMAARFDKIAGDKDSIIDGIRCYKLAAGFYEDASYLIAMDLNKDLMTYELNKSRSDALLILAANSHVESARMMIKRGVSLTVEKIEIAEALESASKIYYRVNNLEKSQKRLSEAVRIIKSTQPIERKEFEAVLGLLHRAEIHYWKTDDVAAGSDVVLAHITFSALALKHAQGSIKDLERGSLDDFHE